MRRALAPTNSVIPRFREKLRYDLIATVTVLQTDTGGRGEYPKAFERTLLKELGKMTP
jgi:hypothetical protein